MQDRVYKIFTESEWRDFQKTGQFGGSVLDKRDGFIHLSAKHQVAGVVERFFAGKRPLYVAEFLSLKFRDNLKWEISDFGEAYPHLYGDCLLISEVSAFSELRC